MKSCELCESAARMYCESDSASLCWECDLKVHGANFLVGRHTRTLLCHVCYSLTPWSASGTHLGPTVSICHNCSSLSLPPEERDSRPSDVLDLDSLDDDDDDESDDDDDDYSDEDDEEEERENQVVPACLPLSTAMTVSSSQEELCDDAEDFPSSSSSTLSLKRNRDCLDLGFQEQTSVVSDRRDNVAMPSRSDKIDDHSIMIDDEDEDARPLKEQRTEPVLDQTIQGRTQLIKDSMAKIEGEIASGYGTSRGILGLCRLSRDQR